MGKSARLGSSGMVKAAFIGGMALVAAGVAATLFGLAGWGFLGFAAGFVLVFRTFVERPLVRYAGALAAAVMSVALLMPLAPKAAPARRAGPPPATIVPSPTPRPEGSLFASSGVGPPEEVRRAVFRELVAAEERAKREAYAAHPDRDPGGAVSDAERAAKRVEKRARLLRLLEAQYRKEIAARYQVPEESLPPILEEGRGRGWPAEAP